MVCKTIALTGLAGSNPATHTKNGRIAPMVEQRLEAPPVQVRVLLRPPGKWKHLLKNFLNRKTRSDVPDSKPGAGFIKPRSAVVVTSCMLLHRNTLLAQPIGNRFESYPSI